MVKLLFISNVDAQLIISTTIFIGNTFFILFTMKIFFENFLLYDNSWENSYFEVKISISQPRAICSELLVSE